MKTLRLFPVFVLVALFMSGLTARAKVPPLLDVPDYLPGDVKKDLTAQRSDLEKQIASLRKQTADFNAKCGNRTLAEDDPLAKDCLDEKALLDHAGQDYTRAALSFDDRVSKATASADARNIPADLPPDLENTIAATFHDSPPEVAERVRNGFQAFTNGDLKTAKASFVDALSHDHENVYSNALLPK